MAEGTIMHIAKSKKIHATEFTCQAPLKFYEHCNSCPRIDGCPDLALIKEILRMKKNVNYNMDLWSGRGQLEGSRNSVDASAFTCLAPLHFFEKTRKKCAHRGRCREEGLLLALLTGKKKLTYSKKVLITLPTSKTRTTPTETLETPAEESATL
jgi:hypothetical protein